MDKEEKFPFIIFSLLIGIALLSLTGAIWFAHQTYSEISDSLLRNSRLLDAHEKIVHFDEILTMSASMASKTGDNAWIERYHHYEPQLDIAIKKAISLSGSKSVREAVSTTDKANITLVELEKQSFLLVNNGKLDQAWEILSDEKYKKAKQVYAKGMENLANAIQV